MLNRTKGKYNVAVESVALMRSDHLSTYVFIFDSLGSKHPQAIKTLSMYLQLEAKDKKGNTDTRKPIGKLALVRTDPRSLLARICIRMRSRSQVKETMQTAVSTSFTMCESS